MFVILENFREIMVLILLGDLAYSLKFEAFEIINLLLAWDQAPHCGKKGKKSVLMKKKSASKVS